MPEKGDPHGHPQEWPVQRTRTTGAASSDLDGHDAPLILFAGTRRRCLVPLSHAGPRSLITGWLAQYPELGWGDELGAEGALEADDAVSDGFATCHVPSTPWRLP